MSHESRQLLGEPFVADPHVQHRIGEMKFRHLGSWMYSFKDLPEGKFVGSVVLKCEPFVNA